MAIKRKTRMYEPWGYQEENNYQGSETIFDNDLESFFADVKYIDGDKKIHFYNKDGEEKATLDVTQFAPSVVESAVYDKTTKILTITFSNGDKVEINLADLIDENEFADGLMVDNGIVKVMIDSTGEPYLSVSQNGIKISGVDQAIADAVEAEKNRAEAAEQALQDAIDAEVQRAQNAETALDNKIDQEIADRIADVDEEETRAKAAEANLSRRLDTLNDELDAEKTIREAADVALGRRIDQEIDDRKADVDEEEARAKAAEQALQDAIDAEEARATSAETALQAAIEAEGQRAQDAEAALQEAIDAETARATSAETELQAAIEAEGQRAQDAEAALDEKIDDAVSALTDAITEETDRATTAEEALDTKIDNVESALTAAIEAEKTRAEGVEADLAAAIEGLGGNKFDDVDYDSSAKTINFYAEGSVVKSLDATPFIKDGMIERVYIETDTQELVIVWNEASGKTEETRIPLSDIFNPDNYYTKDEIDDKVDEINSAITAVEGDITTIQGDIVDINSAITEIQGDITTIEGDITNINSAITNVQGDITNINSSITEINEAIDDMEDQYGDEISALTDSVRELEETVENDEFTVAMALNDLNTRKLDASAYTPTDLSNYYTKDETSGKTEIADALDEKANLSDIPSVTPYADSVKYNSTTHFVEFYHGTTAGTKVFEYDASPFLIDGMVESVEVVTVDNVKYLRITWNSAAGGQVTDIPLGDLFDPSLYYTKDEIDAAEYTISKALVDLDERKLDASAYTPTDLSNYYTKSETYSKDEANARYYTKSETYSKDEVDARDLWVSGTGTNAVVLKGASNTANGIDACAEGGGNKADGGYSHAEGYATVAKGLMAHTEGYYSSGTSDASHAEGNRTLATAQFSHAEGNQSIASGSDSHAEGTSSSATTNSAHAEGFHTLASGGYSHAEGYATVASGNFTHVEGNATSATTSYAHAEGEATAAKGPHSHAEGYNTITNNDGEHASGKFNVSTTGLTSAVKTLFSIGNGTANDARHNAFEVRENGDIYITINGNDVLLQDYITELERITAKALTDLDSRLRALEG